MRLTYANVVASIALFVALGGTGYAATQLPLNSVGTPQLKKGAVTKAKISRATRRALRGQRGPTGLVGGIGPEGATGPRGQRGLEGPRGERGETGAPGAASSTMSFFVGPTNVITVGADHEILTGAIPGPGTYTAIARVNVTPSGTQEVTCSLSGSQSTIGGIDVVGAKGDGVTQTLTLMYQGHFDAPLAPAPTPGFFLACRANTATSVQVKQAKIDVIRVDSATF